MIQTDESSSTQQEVLQAAIADIDKTSVTARQKLKTDLIAVQEKWCDFLEREIASEKRVWQRRKWKQQRRGWVITKASPQTFGIHQKKAIRKGGHVYWRAVGLWNWNGRAAPDAQQEGAHICEQRDRSTWTAP